MREKLTRILVVTKYRFIGDTLNAVPTLRAIKQRWPSSEVTLLSGSRACELLQNCPLVDKFVEFDPYRESDKGVLQYVALLRRLRREKFDIALVLNRSFHSALTAVLGGARRRASWSGFECRDFMLTDLCAYNHDKLESECFLDVFRCTGTEYNQSPALQLWLTPGELAQATESLPCSDFILGLQPGATHDYKQWPLQNFIAMAERLVEHSPEMNIVLIGGSDEEEIAMRFVANSSPLLASRVINLVGRLSLRKTLAVVSQLSAFVGNDTAIRHAAVASDTLSIGLFGPTSYSKWGNARPPRHIVLSAASGKMDDISVDNVIESIASWKAYLPTSATEMLDGNDQVEQHYSTSDYLTDRSVPDASFVLERSLNE